MKANPILRHVAIASVLLALVGAASEANGQDRVERSKSEADALIAQAGSTSPDWWNAVELEYPETLDLNWPVRQGFGEGPGGFEERGRGGRGRGRGRRGGPFGGGDSGFGRDPASPTNVDDYLIRVVYPNPSRYKAGIKLVHHLMIRNKDDREKVKRSLNTLGEMFYGLLGDYARAAFWWQKCDQMGGTTDSVKLARCYFELGSQAAAVELLSQTDGNNARNAKDAIKLWARIGQVDKALSMIESLSGTGGQGMGGFDRRGPRGMTRSDKYLLSAEICRSAGRYDDALAYYEKILALPDSETRPWNHHETDDKFHADINRIGTESLKKLDLKRIPDGPYTATVEAYGGQMTVQVVLKNGNIESVDVTRHWETYEYFVMAQPTARQMVEKQSVAGADVITGATVTSDAIINAVAAALAKAMQ